MKWILRVHQRSIDNNRNTKRSLSEVYIVTFLTIVQISARLFETELLQRKTKH